MEESELEAELVDAPSSLDPIKELDNVIDACALDVEALTSCMADLTALKMDLNLFGVFRGSAGGTNPSISRLDFNSRT